jgi:hypothetical protein
LAPGASTRLPATAITTLRPPFVLIASTNAD